MITVTAPEYQYMSPSSTKVFLAGGIQKCKEWQKTVIHTLNDCYDSIHRNDSIFILNPRRAEWLDKPGEAKRQIEWEFDMIERCDLFTMFFDGSDSDQPICMYELGRNIERMKEKFPSSWMNRIIITCDKKYKRVFDVVTQSELATDGKVQVNVVDTDVRDAINEHTIAIAEAILIYS